MRFLMMAAMLTAAGCDLPTEENRERQRDGGAPVGDAGASVDGGTSGGTDGAVPDGLVPEGDGGAPGDGAPRPDGAPVGDGGAGGDQGPDAALPDAGPHCEPEAEVCDGTDNDCDGEIDEELGVVYIPAGAFVDVDGEEAVTEAFCLGRTEVTGADYRACVEAGACDEPAAQLADCTWNVQPWDRGGAERPMNCLALGQVGQFLAWAGARLPTLAEWTKGYRGGCELRGDPAQCDEFDAPRYPWGDTPPPSCQIAALAIEQPPVDGEDPERIPGCGSDMLSHAGRYPAGTSPYGVLDMVGSLWEATDGCTGGTGPCQVWGYSYGNSPTQVSENTFRPQGWPAGAANRFIGFRIAADPGWRPPD